MDFNPADLLDQAFPTAAVSELLERTLGQWAVDEAAAFSPPQDMTQHLTAFVVGPIVEWYPDDTSCGRLSVSNVVDDASWTDVIRQRWSSVATSAFLSQVSGPCRKMIDVSPGGATLYLDDLHEVEHTFRAPVSGPLLCATLDLQTHETSVMSRHLSFPFDVLGEHAQQFARHGERMPREGVWGIRWQDALPRSVLCVTEVKTRGAVEAAMEYLASKEHLPEVRGFRSACLQHGVRPYLDSAELYPSGRVDLTLGVLGPG